MNIVQVEYRKLVTGTDYSNTTVGATAQVNIDQGENAETVLGQLRDWVNEHLSQESITVQELLEKRQQLYLLGHEIEDRKNQLEVMNKRWEAVRRILEAHGVDVEKLPEVIDIPF